MFARRIESVESARVVESVEAAYAIDIGSDNRRERDFVVAGSGRAVGRSSLIYGADT